jgi:hypothetical protein
MLRADIAQRGVQRIVPRELGQTMAHIRGECRFAWSRQGKWRRSLHSCIGRGRVADTSSWAYAAD